MTRSAVALIRLATPPAAQTPDAELLRSFVASQADEDAFAELVRRHGPMVLAVCRRVLSDAHDAEDAFQAVFLMLARKAGAIRGTNLAGWLYGVAVRTARGVRIMRDRRQKREQAVSASVGRKPPVLDSPTDYDTARTIDEELAKLPEHYRDAIIVCELRGLSRKDAARELGIPEGTLSSRLAAAKRKLAALLAARGITGAVALATVLAPAAVSAALEQSTAFAIRGTATTTANAMASTILKGMLFDQLKRTVLAAGLLLTAVCGGLAMSGSPDSPTTNPPANVLKPADEPAVALVKQLGSEDFAEREAASKELRSLGSKAEPVLRAGLKSENPEVRARCERVLAEIRKDALDALAKAFDPKAENVPDHPIWRRFKAIAGDTPASRELFASIIKNAEWRRRLDAAETGPDAAARQYHEAMVDVGRIFNFNMSVGFVIYVWPCDTADQTAYLLLLGSYPRTESAKPSERDRRMNYFGVGESQLIHAKGLRLGLQEKEIVSGAKYPPETAALTKGSDRVFAKLFAAWMGRREPGADIAGMPSAFWLAAKYGVREVLPLAHVVAADKFPHGREPPAALYGAALAVIARFGTPTDLPLFEQHFRNAEVVGSFELEGPVPVGSKDSNRGTAQLRDVAMGLALLLHGEDPAAHRFLLASSKRAKPGERPDVSRYEATDFAFMNGDDKSRLAAHAKVKEFFDKKKEGQKDEPPVTGAKVWPHFAKVVGDDKDCRALFDLIVSNPKNLELLEKAAAGNPDLLKLYRARRDELNKQWDKRLQEATEAYDPEPRAPVDEVAGWLLLGTYPNTKADDPDGRQPGSLHFTDFARGPTARPLRKLVAAWLANRGDEPHAIASGFGLALGVDIPDALPTAKRIAEKYAGVKNYLNGIIYVDSLLIIGKYGTKADLPLVARFANDTTVVCILRPKQGTVKPGTVEPVDGQDSTTQMRDYALAVAIHLNGGDPRDFGFVRGTVFYGSSFPNPHSFSEIGFLSKSARDAAHKKAKEWLDKQKK